MKILVLAAASSAALNQKSFDPPISNSSLVQEFLAHYQRFFTRRSFFACVGESVVISAFLEASLVLVPSPRDSSLETPPIDERKLAEVIHC